MSTVADRWQRISECFDRLIDLDPAARQQALVDLRRSDAGLAAEVERLLAADALDNPLLDADSGGVARVRESLREATPEGEQIGSYRLLHRLGQGGMGEVWYAERTDGSYDQRVAVKLLRPGMDTHAILRRFLQERRILARLRHPNIVRLIDAGMSSGERPCYVMELVEGESLTDHAAAHHLDVRARVHLMSKVADAVAHAHTQLVVHRDLKPGNVLVDAEGEPRVLDFGIAKLLEASGEQTRTGTALQAMSPAYAAPEQLRGEPIGTATDVHALGLMLFELLTGTLPQNRRASNLAQLALVAGEETSERPSATITQGGGVAVRATYGDRVDARQLSRSLSGDLDLIVTTAMQRDPARRYATAAAFAADLRNWLDRRPIAARADSASYRLRKFIRRHRLGVAVGVLMFLALIGALGAALWQARVARSEAARAEMESANARRELARAERIKDFLLGLFGEQDPISRASANARSPLELVRAGIASVDAQLGKESDLRAVLLRDLGEIQGNLGDREGAEATLERAWTLQGELSGARSLASAEAMAAYASALDANGKQKEAEPKLREALGILREQGAGDGMPAVRAESTLAMIELIKGNNAEAEKLARHGVDVLRKTFGDDDMRLAMRLGVLGKIQQESGNYPQALASLTEALGIVARNNGEDHVRTALLRTNIGEILRSQHKFDEARDHYDAALRIERATLPEGHAYIGGTLLRLGDLQRRAGDHAAAEQSFREALRILGAKPSGQYAQALQSYAALARAEGRFEEAARRLRRSFELFRSISGDSTYTWLTALLEVQVLIKAGQLQAAAKLGEEAVAALHKVAPDDLYNNTFAASVMGSLHAAQGRHVEAVGLLRKALQGLDTMYGPDHPEAIEARVVLAASLLRADPQGSREEAQTLIASAFARLEANDEASVMHILGKAHLARGRLKWIDGDRKAALADVDAAIALLQAPEHAPDLHEARQFRRDIGT